MSTQIRTDAAVQKSYYYLLFFFSLAVTMFYVACVTPSLGFRDGPELVVTATYLDIAHPAGFPTYNLLAKILTWLPLGSLGFRVSVFSALAGGATIFFLGLLLAKIHNLKKDSPPSLPWLWTALPAMALASPIWAASIEVEVYSLNLLFIVGLLYCAASWFEGRSIAWLYAGGLLYGLSCGNHAALALYLPVLLLLTLLGAPRKAVIPKGPIHGAATRIGFLAIVFLVGLSVYIFLFIRANIDYLPINFGYPNSLERFFYHVSDAKDSDVHASGLLAFNKLFFYLKFHFQNLTSVFFWPALPLVIWGLVFLWRYYQILSVALVTLILINMGFFFYWIDGVSAFLPSVLAWFILLSLGLGELGRFLRHLQPGRAGIAIAALLAVFLTLILAPARYQERETEAGFLATEMFWPDFVNLPPESVVLQSNNWFSAAAIQAIYSARPDVTLINWPWLYQARNTPPPNNQRFPLALLPKNSDGQFTSYLEPNYYSAFLNLNLDSGRKIYIQFSEDASLLSPYIKPDPNFMFLGRLLADNSAAQEAAHAGEFGLYLSRLMDYFDRLAEGTDPPLARKAPAYLFYIVRPILGFIAEQGDYASAEKVMRHFKARFSDPVSGRLLIPYDAGINAQAFFCELLVQQKRYHEATAEFETLIALDPSIGYSYYLLGSNYDKLGNIEAAMANLYRASEVDPLDVEIALRLGSYLAKNRSQKAAVDFLDEKAAYFFRQGLSNSGQAVIKFRDNLIMPPDNSDLSNENSSLGPSQ
ncbi:MAG: DUF2723 domain-containing protein [Deltaproteobacteria bacterium]|jgi:tetratricopeptide (TPR) repeat protein|nr:DUF2723 domain-containing protein [Deltaproteobacteria bacterium]